MGVVQLNDDPCHAARSAGACQSLDGLATLLILIYGMD